MELQTTNEIKQHHDDSILYGYKFVILILIKELKKKECSENDIDY